MEVLHPKNHVAPTFKGYKIEKSVDGVVEYALKKKKFEYWDTLSFLTAVTSATGFAVGGVGLLSDYFNKSKDVKVAKPSKDEPYLIPAPITEIPMAFSNFATASGQISYTGKKEEQTKNGEQAEKGGAKTIVPSTKFSKLALVFAKIGIAFSGIAGIFNGVSMGLPLMAAGETLNLGASPIIETPLGTGLFGIALAAIFSGRALEKDPMLKMDYSKLTKENGIAKNALYVLDNMKGCVKEVWKSAKIFGTHIGGLFSKTKKADAISFFRDSVFSIKPKQVIFQEKINKDGVVNLAKDFKNNPYLMHAASLILAVGGATLALSSVFKSKTGQKVGLKTYETGGSLDNLGLSRSGLEKAAISRGVSGRVSGNLLGLSGAAILAGQPGVDEKWGRGIQWVGTGLLFSVFAIERWDKAFKTIKSKPELTSLIRQWEVDLTKLYTKSELSEKIAGSKFNTRLDSLINFIKGAEKKEVKDSNDLKTIANNLKHKTEYDAEAALIKDEKFMKIFEHVKATVDGKNYQEQVINVADEFKHAFKQEGNAGIAEELKKTLQKDSDKIFEQA